MSKLYFVLGDDENGSGTADNITNRDYEFWILKQPDGSRCSVPSTETVEGIKAVLRSAFTATRATKRRRRRLSG